jgi:hypothetical protein
VFSGRELAMNIRRRASILAMLAAALGACSVIQMSQPAPRQPGDNPLITNPEGTVDTTHGAVGAQTSPR